MELTGYFRAVRKRWWIALMAAALGAGVAMIVTTSTRPQYATSLTFFVNTPNRGVTEAYQGGMFSQQRVRSYADLLGGDRLAKMIEQDYQIGMSVPDIQARISARPVPNTVLLTVTVSDGDPARSALLANAVAGEFAELVQSLERTAANEKQTVSVSVVDGPTLNPVPVTPRPIRNLGLGMFLGLLLGCAAAVLREILDTTVKSVDALAETTGTPALGVVPFDVAARKSPLIVADAAKSLRAEAFRQIRTNLTFVNVDSPVRSIVVTSSHREEGKSTTSCNLAIALATAGERVLLVEADLRRPRLGHYLGLESAVGLADVLANQVRVDDVTQTWGNFGLSVLLGGSIPPNPSELVGSRQMADLLALLVTRYDRIILDTPPLLPVTDAAVVAAQTDGAILVTRSGRTSTAHCATAVGALHAVGASLLGCVLTMHRVNHDKSTYYPYLYTAREPELPAIPHVAAQQAAGPTLEALGSRNGRTGGT